MICAKREKADDDKQHFFFSLLTSTIFILSQSPCPVDITALGTLRVYALEQASKNSQCHPEVKDSMLIHVDYFFRLLCSVSCYFFPPRDEEELLVSAVHPAF